MSDRPKSNVKGLLQRINDGETIIVAEGYIFAFERMGYLKAGPFTPEVVVDHPELVRQMYKDFVRAGSDVVQAFTYYGNRHKMGVVGRSDDLENQNRLALKMAREVADETGTLMCGDLSNTFVYQSDNDEAIKNTKDMFKEQVAWAVDEGADYIVGETFAYVGEALLAVESIKKYGKGVPAVITLSSHVKYDEEGRTCTLDGVEMNEALRQLAEAGADVVGFNCTRGPETIMKLVESASKVGLKVPLAVLPVVYRTTDEYPSFSSIPDPKTGERAFPDMDCLLCSRREVVAFGQHCAKLKIPYVGLCCGNAPHYTRVLAESYGRRPMASKYSPDMTMHGWLGTKKEVVNDHYSSAYKTFEKDNF
ncbi:betaine--homocysteine S-methyltransferase 1-like [Lytechinus variegatus]|uniref:betaine--homocysteine S-methyltransferase 1-like n=1 Tax=Lytechinus variegatus TaxID=7654 RepID=UPI001BB129CB|nr:betaine--homocysteine S-methyltransferase 1-like [Lytechinus variegatus]